MHWKYDPFQVNFNHAFKVIHVVIVWYDAAINIQTLSPFLQFPKSWPPSLPRVRTLRPAACRICLRVRLRSVCPRRPPAPRPHTALVTRRAAPSSPRPDTTTARRSRPRRRSPAPCPNHGPPPNRPVRDPTCPRRSPRAPAVWARNRWNTRPACWTRCLPERACLQVKHHWFLGIIRLCSKC